MLGISAPGFSSCLSFPLVAMGRERGREGERERGREGERERGCVADVGVGVGCVCRFVVWGVRDMLCVCVCVCVWHVRLCVRVRLCVCVWVWVWVWHVRLCGGVGVCDHVSGWVREFRVGGLDGCEGGNASGGVEV